MIIITVPAANESVLTDHKYEYSAKYCIIFIILSTYTKETIKQKTQFVLI